MLIKRLTNFKRFSILKKNIMSCSNIITNPTYDFDRYLKYDELKYG